MMYFPTDYFADIKRAKFDNKSDNGVKAFVSGTVIAAVVGITTAFLYFFLTR